jgi:hypothetical protein
MTKLTAFALFALSTAIATASLSGTPVAADDLRAAGLRIKPQPLTGRAKRGYVFAKAHCSGCHGITANTPSPNPASPPFDAIANMPALSALTLSRFLEDSHNFPDAMNFRVNHKQVGDLAAYILTLRGTDYRPEI